MDTVLSLAARCHELVGHECFSNADCEVVFRDAFVADVSMSDGPDNSLPTAALKRSHTAGLLAACMHIWKCVVVDGRRVAHRDANDGRVDLFCCLKDTTACLKDATAAANETRCFVRRMKPHFDAVTEICSVVARCIDVAHPSFDPTLSKYTDIGRLSRAALGHKILYNAVVEGLRDDTTAMSRRAMTPSLSGAEGADGADGAAAEWPPIPHDVGSIVPFSVDLREEAMIIMRAHDIMSPATQAQPPSAAKYSRGDISRIAHTMCAMYTRSTTFYIIPMTNAAVRHIVDMTGV